MMLGYRDVFRYFQCSDCGCLQIENIPADMSRYYPGNYYSYQHSKQPNLLKRMLVRTRDNFMVTGKGAVGRALSKLSPNTRLSFLRPLALTEDACILDVGCGAGALLNRLSNMGFKQVLGIDPFNEHDIRYHNGVTIEKKTIREIGGKWDLIMFNHSFEHLPDPAETLDKVATMLKPGGHCVIRIPTVSSYAWNHYGVNWVQLDAPRHFFLHSIMSIKILAKHCDMKLTDVYYDSTPFQFWGSEQYLKDIPLSNKQSFAENPVASIFSAQQIAEFTRRATELNESGQGDQAIFYLQHLQAVER